MTAPVEQGRDIALLVDDAPDSLSVVTDALEEAGITVLAAKSGETALSLVDRVTPDIILLDAVMPGLGGFDTCRRLKQKPRLAYVPVIFMTGLSETESVVEGLKAGGIDYVTKPIAPDELIARIGVHLANARMWQAAASAIDAAGRSLAAIGQDGTLSWASPMAQALMTDSGILDCSRSRIDTGTVKDWIFRRLAVPATPGEDRTLALCEDGGTVMSFITTSGRGEALVHVTRRRSVSDHQIIREKLSVTAREADVLRWISRGKSNRDIAEILSLSPRTVNKHLEQIYAKLGVENRTAAAAMTLKVLVET